MKVALGPGSRGDCVLSVDAGDGHQKTHLGLRCRKKFVQLGDREERKAGSSQPAPELLQLQHPAPCNASGHTPGPSPGSGWGPPHLPPGRLLTYLRVVGRVQLVIGRWVGGWVGSIIYKQKQGSVHLIHPDFIHPT